MTTRIPISPVAGTPSLLDQVYNHLLEAICDCRLEPGTVLRQEELAHNLGVSRQPVQQALQLRSEEHTSELQSLMRISYAVFCLQKKTRHETKVQKIVNIN